VFYNHIRIRYLGPSTVIPLACLLKNLRSMFHPTTLDGGQRVMDPYGEHMTFDARALVNNVPIQDWRVGHAYVTGLDQPHLAGLQNPDEFYTLVELDRIIWEGGIEGSSSGSSGGSRTPGRGSPGGSQGGSKGGSQGGSPRGAEGVSSRGNQGGSQGGSSRGTQGVSSRGSQGASHGGSPGGSRGGSPGGSANKPASSRPALGSMSGTGHSVSGNKSGSGRIRSRPT
jgi:hypothetical protein